MIRTIALAALTALCIAPAALADGRVDNRQDRQAARIASGVESGALTGREARRLEAGQAGVARAEERLAEDGFTRAEKLRLERRQDVQSRRIFRQSRDRQRGG